MTEASIINLLKFIRESEMDGKAEENNFRDIMILVQVGLPIHLPMF